MVSNGFVAERTKQDATAAHRPMHITTPPPTYFIVINNHHQYDLFIYQHALFYVV